VSDETTTGWPRIERFLCPSGAGAEEAGKRRVAASAVHGLRGGVPPLHPWLQPVAPPGRMPRRADLCATGLDALTGEADAAAVEVNAGPARVNAPVVRGDARAVGADGRAVEADARAVEADARAVEADARAV
jgi:hypothetical protein